MPRLTRSASEGHDSLPIAGLRILVPLDASHQALRALTCARRLAACTKGRILLLRASRVNSQAVRDGVERLAARLQAGSLSVEWRVVPGTDAASTILDAAREWRPDLIAMATTNQNALDRSLNGSVVDAVIPSAPVPVLIVPPRCPRPPPETRPCRLACRRARSRSARPSGRGSPRTRPRRRARGPRADS